MVNKITTPPTQNEVIEKINELVDGKQDTLTAGTGIDITNDVISVTSDISTGAALGTTAVQPSALNGYATQAWVGQQGYITGITSSDVTTALGYTPYNSTNPNGYITSSALTPYALSEDLASVATSGSYNDLSDKPTIPAAQVNSDWNATSGVARILNKPTIPTVNNPTITFTQGGTTKGTIKLNQSSDQTVAFDAGGGSYTAGTGIDITNDVISVTNAISTGAALGATALQPSALNGYATESYVTTATANMQTTGNLVTSISSTSTNAQYPSAKCVYDIVGDIETALHTINSGS